MNEIAAITLNALTPGVVKAAAEIFEPILDGIERSGGPLAKMLQEQRQQISGAIEKEMQNVGAAFQDVWALVAGVPNQEHVKAIDEKVDVPGAAYGGMAPTSAAVAQAPEVGGPDTGRR